MKGSEMSNLPVPLRFKNWLENDLSSVETIGLVLFTVSAACSALFGQTAIAIFALLLIGPAASVVAVLYCLKPVSLTDGEGKWFWNLGRAIIYFGGFGVLVGIFMKYIVPEMLAR
jgi:hypothetical protein